MGYVYCVVAVPEYHVPGNMKDAVGAFVNLGVVKEEVLIGEEVPDVYKIDERERHLNLIDRVKYSILLKNLLQKEPIENDPEYDERRAHHPPRVICTLLNIEEDHIVRLYVHSLIAREWECYICHDWRMTGLTL